MASVFAVLAGGIVILHFAFVLFAVAGALLALQWRWVPWLHVPAATWAVLIELSGGICPLTPLENDLRAKAGLDHYSGDFVARYVFPVLYPSGLTHDAQVVIGVAVVVVNAIAYTFIYATRKSRWKNSITSPRRDA